MKYQKLSSVFASIQTKEQILEQISSNALLASQYNSWKSYEQESFINMCTGNRGVKMLYDSYFKEIFNPEYDSERLSYLLTVLLERTVTVKMVLPNDSTRIGDETSLIITDIVVELEDHTIANIEVQKIGYKFAGERASCYSADLLLRQYKRLKDQTKEHFSYKDIAPVYTIVFFENSPAIFKDYPDEYIHRFSTRSNTGISLNMLQNYIFIPVDIFLKKLHNEGIKNELDAWLTFLGCDEPEYIIRLIEEYPYFKPLYADLYEMCQNIERVMSMYSKELQVLDRNTVKYMIDELQEELDDMIEKLDDAHEQLNSTTQQLNDANQQLNDANQQLNDANQQLAEKDALIAKLQEELQEMKS